MICLQNLFIVLYKDVKIYISIYLDTKNCDKKYIKISFLSFTVTNYIDIFYNIDDIPYQLLKILEFSEKNSSISLSEDGLGYILKGPCLETGKIYNTGFIFIADYNNMLSSNNEFLYNKELSDNLTEMYIYPIYNYMERNNII